MLSQKVFFIENTHRVYYIHFSVKNIYFDKIDIKLFYFHVTSCVTPSLTRSVNLSV